MIRWESNMGYPPQGKGQRPRHLRASPQHLLLGCTSEEPVYGGQLCWSASYGLDPEVTNQVFLTKQSLHSYALALDACLSIGTCSRTAANWHLKIWCLLYWVVYSVVINSNQPKQNLSLQTPSALPPKCMVSSHPWSPVPTHRRTPRTQVHSALQCQPAPSTQRASLQKNSHAPRWHLRVPTNYEQFIWSTV